MLICTISAFDGKSLISNFSCRWSWKTNSGAKSGTFWVAFSIEEQGGVCWNLSRLNFVCVIRLLLSSVCRKNVLSRFDARGNFLYKPKECGNVENDQLIKWLLNIFKYHTNTLHFQDLSMCKHTNRAWKSYIYSK